MPYTPPPRDNVQLVVGGPYSPPARGNVSLQLADDPLRQPALSNIAVSLNSVSFNYDGYLAANPQADKVRVEYRHENSSSWTLVGEYTNFTGTVNITGLLEGHRYFVRVAVMTELSPSPKLSDYVQIDRYTDFLITINQFKDTNGNVLANAVIVALPEEELLNLVQISNYGSDWPSLSYARANKTNAQGSCNIRIPGGKGKVWILAIPPSTSVSGATISNLNTKV